MSFTNGMPFVVCEKDINARWSGHVKPKNLNYHPQFRCKLCGHKFVVGDSAKFIFDGKSGNFFVCPACDTPDAKEKMAALIKESKERFWWLWEDINELNDEAKTMCRDCRRDNDGHY